jgi:hypothetical protein
MYQEMSINLGNWGSNNTREINGHMKEHATAEHVLCFAQTESVPASFLC